MKKGFTLIEVLVVVLIIGILAAIALPKYQVAVDKSRLANLQAQVKAIKTAFDNYYLTTGQWPDSFDKLDVGFTGYTKTTPPSEECYVFKESYCCVGKEQSGFQAQNITCGVNDYSFGLLNFGEDKYYCYAENGNERALRLCSQYGNFYANYNLVTPYGHTTGRYGQRYSVYEY